MALPSGNPYAPGNTGAAWVANVYDPEFDRLCYQQARLIKTVTVKQAPKGGLVIPQHGNLTPTTVAGTADMSGLSLPFASNTETSVTVSPSSVTLNVSVNDNQVARMMSDPEDMLKTSIEMALGAKQDTDVASLIPVLATNFAGSYAAPMSKSDFLALMADVEFGCGEYANEGLFFVYHTKVKDAVFNIDAFVSAAFRGVTAGAPAQSGVLPTAFGVNFVSCGNMATSGGGYANSLHSKRAFVIAHNIRPNVKMQEFGHAKWLLSLMDYGYAKQRDQYAGLLKSA